MSEPIFIPTYLMIKRHRTTGLMYFCKTSTRDPLKYHGSGVYWRKHLKIHGRQVDTVWYQLFYEKDDLTEFALFFSEFHDVVRATKDGKKVWANEVPEDGLQGGQNRGMPSTQKGVKQPHVAAALTGKKRPEHSKLLTGRKQSEDHIGKRADALRGNPKTKKHRDNISNAKKGKKLEIKRVYRSVTCNYCGTEGKGPNMSRYHLENCKHKGKIIYD